MREIGPVKASGKRGGAFLYLKQGRGARPLLPRVRG